MAKAESDNTSRRAYQETPDGHCRALIAYAHALISVSHELTGYEEHLANSVYQLANDVLDHAEALAADINERSERELAEAGNE